MLHWCSGFFYVPCLSWNTLLRPGWPRTQKSAFIVGIKDISHPLLVLIYGFKSTLNHKGYVICTEEPSVHWVPLDPACSRLLCHSRSFFPVGFLEFLWPFIFMKLLEMVRREKRKFLWFEILTSKSIFLYVCCIYYWRFDTAYWEAKDSWDGSVYTLGFLITHQGL